MTEKEREILNRWQRSDETLYRHFHRNFDQRVQAFGLARMAEQVEKLKKLRAKAIEDCNVASVTGESKKQPSYAKPYRSGLQSYSGG